MKAQLLKGKHGEFRVRVEDKGHVKVVPLEDWNKKLQQPIVPPKNMI
jgi:hypothetical protein